MCFHIPSEYDHIDCTNPSMLLNKSKQKKNYKAGNQKYFNRPTELMIILRN